MYGTDQEDGKQSGEGVCGGPESGATEIPVKEHVYELTSGYTYDVPNKVTYSIQGPSEEMVITFNNYHVHLHIVARMQTLVNAWNLTIVRKFGLIRTVFGFVNLLCLPTLTASVFFSLPTLSITTHQCTRVQWFPTLSFLRG